ncbi:hypothetical protein [Nocardia sp. BMG51109]|uniref:hypothetical protein n=1 Tax=Nocardia sp. BMG51109 TaxID=1056816 RepID=UPI000463DB35|nr:hypothetical protein [Nocardia sp. BMG51109]
MTDRIPRIEEIMNAMKGVVPESHRHIDTLRAAWLLATLDEWLTLDTITTSAGETMPDMLRALDFGDYRDMVHRQLVERIRETGPRRRGYADAVGRLAAAWRAWKREVANDDDNSRSLMDAARELEQARWHYIGDTTVRNARKGSA